LPDDLPSTLTPPKIATHWRARYCSLPEEGEKAGPYGLYHEKLAYDGPNGRAAVWPIAEFSSEEVGDRWGDGTYVIIWCKHSKEPGMSGTSIHTFGKDVLVVGRPSHLPDEEDDEDEEEGDTEPEAAEPEAEAVAAPPRRARSEAPPLPRPPKMGYAQIPLTTPIAPQGGMHMDPFATLHYLLELARSTRAEARQEAEFAIKRYEIDTKASLDRERMANERILAQQQQFYRETKRGGGEALDARDVARELEEVVEDKLDAMKEEVIRELKGGGAQDAPGPSTAQIVGEIVQQATGAVPGLMQAYGAMKNGAAAGALPSGS
jgi:hypothetical protein